MPLSYTGDGSYNPDPTKLTATYGVNLPAGANYRFFTTDIYNFSSTFDRNVILIFMDVTNGPNTDLTNMANVMQPGFSFDLKNVKNVSSSCVPLEKTKNITVIIRHDSERNIAAAKAELYLGDLNESQARDRKNKSHVDIDWGGGIGENPKKHGLGTLRPISS